MTQSLAIDVRAAVAWLWEDAQPLATLSDAARLEHLATLAHGTGLGEADRLWYAERTVDPAASDVLQLSALPVSYFGQAGEQALARVKALVIVNRAGEVGRDLWLGGGDAAEWAAPFVAAGHRLRVAADSCLLWLNQRDGWPVSAGVADELKLHNPHAAAVTYRIVIAGTSA